jgi:hypothetical protein
MNDIFQALLKFEEFQTCLNDIGYGSRGIYYRFDYRGEINWSLDTYNWMRCDTEVTDTITRMIVKFEKNLSTLEKIMIGLET